MIRRRRTTMRRLLLGLPVLILGVGACGSDDDTGADTTDVAGTTPPSTSPPPTTSAETMVIAETDPPSTEPAPPDGGAVGTDEAQAIADLAARLGVDPAAITTVSVENVTWRDGSIGCPEDGVNYIQVLTDGVRVVLEFDGTSYQYHSGGGQGVFLCAKPEPAVGE